MSEIDDLRFELLANRRATSAFLLAASEFVDKDDREDWRELVRVKMESVQVPRETQAEVEKRWRSLDNLNNCE